LSELFYGNKFLMGVILLEGKSIIQPVNKLLLP